MAADQGGVGLSWKLRDEQLARLRSSWLTWGLLGEQMRAGGVGRLLQPLRPEMPTRVAPAGLGEAVRFWAQFEEVTWIHHGLGP